MEISTITGPVSAFSPEQKKQPSELSPEEKKQRRARAAKALANARQRCTNPNNKDYANYGGLGIKVFMTLDELIAAIGLPSLNVSLDRIDPTGHYEVGNVRWASKVVQAANKKSSPGGSTLPLQMLIAQQQLAVELTSKRPKVAEAWQLLTKAFNRGYLGTSDDALLTKLLGLKGTALVTFRPREVMIDGKAQIIFRLPALTLPNAIVDVRGPSNPAPDDKQAVFQRHGLLFSLRHIEGTANVPGSIRNALDQLLKSDEAPGLTLVGQPSTDDLSNGWFEVWMLAAASRLPSIGVGTAFFPAMTCLQLLNEDIGGRSSWDRVGHPLLDTHLLFIPDLQLDCGPWGYLSPYEFGMFEKLLSYRTECGHKTVVGVQAPQKLSSQLQKLLLGVFSVHQVANGTKPHGA